MHRKISWTVARLGVILCYTAVTNSFTDHPANATGGCRQEEESFSPASCAIPARMIRITACPPNLEANIEGYIRWQEVQWCENSQKWRRVKNGQEGEFIFPFWGGTEEDKKEAASFYEETLEQFEIGIHPVIHAFRRKGGKPLKLFFVSAE